MKNLFFISVLILISLHSALGQGKGMIKGIVKEKSSNETLVGAHIILKQAITILVL